jgi:hypothetical protein
MKHREYPIALKQAAVARVAGLTNREQVTI